MIGNNSMHLNEATVIAALQLYYDSMFMKMEDAPKITSVISQSGYFVVAITQKQIKPV